LLVYEAQPLNTKDMNPTTKILKFLISSPILLCYVRLLNLTSYYDMPDRKISTVLLFRPIF
jgi:hypothetical protein